MDWELGWEGRDRQPIENTRLTTLLVRYDGEDAGSAAYSRLERFLRKHFAVTLEYDSPHKERGAKPSLIEASAKGRRHILATTDCGGLTVRALELRSLAKITAFLENEKPAFAGQLRHTGMRFSLNKEGQVSIVTGVEKDDWKTRNLLPHTRCVLLLRRKVIGKAVLCYTNIEMGDFAPTIELLEVKREFRGKGFGVQFLESIEDYIGLHGFDRIWATDAGSTGATAFWKHMGYEDVSDTIGEELLKWL